MYLLNEAEEERLVKGIQAAFAIPFIDDLEDYIWEAVFSYIKEISLSDTLSNMRTKLLFDVVDGDTKRGWSLKALQSSLKLGGEFEVVIQRADIFKKYEQLGFEALSIESDPQILGSALLKHWYGKVIDDAKAQLVDDKRIGILLKSRDRLRYAYFEEELIEYKPEDLEWRWTDKTKTGLQGVRKTDGFIVYRWYPNQKQLFERFMLPKDTKIINVQPRRLTMQQVIQFVADDLSTP